MDRKQLPVTCPLCGRKNEYPPDDLVEGAILVCRHCPLKLTLHGHMLEDIQKEIAKLKEKQ